jgi:hypothetical protein
MVLVVGPIIGIVIGVAWTVADLLFPDSSSAHWLRRGVFHVCMWALAMATMLGITFRPIRREWRVVGDDAARKHVLIQAERMKLQPAVDDGKRLVLRPQESGKTPLWMSVEVRLTDDRVILDGPAGFVRKLAKRLRKSQPA